MRGIAREAGYRTKVAVYSADGKVDPVGACVGLRGARVKNIVRELNNEKVDIIRWSDDPREFVQDALKPAQIKSITIDEAAHQIRITVDEEELSKAIGRRGQNARLTSRLIGWDVQVERDETKHEQVMSRVSDAGGALSTTLEISEDEAKTLAGMGMVDLEAIVTADASDIAGILEIDAERADRIHGRAKAAFERETASA